LDSCKNFSSPPIKKADLADGFFAIGDVKKAVNDGFAHGFCVDFMLMLVLTLHNIDRSDSGRPPESPAIVLCGKIKKTSHFYKLRNGLLINVVTYRLFSTGKITEKAKILVILIRRCQPVKYGSAKKQIMSQTGLVDGEYPLSV